ncbi:MAG: helix-turn-helix domain-containing protein [Clostridia bacterium]|nr:helix-turn-helix domain-containing protein [Clostridia bacterium]
MYNFGQRLKLARESADFTQEKLAEKLGVSRTAVARWESNDIEPKLQNLIGIAELLHVSTDFLLGICCTPNITISNLSDDAILALERLISEIKKSVQDK